MTTFIRPLTDPAVTLESVGGKALSLARLARAGLPVPDGYFVTTEAYRAYVQTNDLQRRILQALEPADVTRPVSLETASESIRKRFMQGAIPGEVANAIAGAYAGLPGSDPAVAVRSSATAEDLPDASFAGQQDTYLNVAGADQVLEATRSCWASLWTARAIGYRLRRGINPDAVALAVVVQLLVNAEAAGIMFTADPVDGSRDRVVISAAWGLGESVVGGTVTPDSLTIHKDDGRVLSRSTAEKIVMTVRTESGTREQQVPDSLRSVPVLSDEQAAELARHGSRIEDLYGMPMDIEWTLADGSFAIVQARPATALPEPPIEWKVPDPRGTYMRTSIADLMPRPLSTLFLTLGIPTMRAQMSPLAGRVVGGEPRLGEHYFTNINTYAYMNAGFPFRGWLWAIFRLIPAYPRMLRQLVPLWRDELHPEYRQSVADRAGPDLARMSPDALWREAQELFAAAAYYMDGLMFATMGASAGSESLFTRLYDRFARHDGDPEALVLLSGWDNIPVRAEKSLYDLAAWIRQDSELTAHVLQTSSGELAQQLNGPVAAQVSNLGELAQRFKDHVSRFGHIVFQLDFAESLPRDHPEMMLETIRMYLRGEGRDPHKRQEEGERRRVEATRQTLARLKGLKRWALRKSLNWAQSLAAVREDALAEIGLAYPRLRELLRALGGRLVEAGAVQAVDDIFWLTRDEIDDCVENLQAGRELNPLTKSVAERRAFSVRLGEVTPPPMIPMKDRVMGFKADIFIPRGEAGQAGDVLKGVPTSPGRCTASARVLRGPDDFDEMQSGDVIVAGATTPAWTPLFAMASAVVTDIGGPLSHGSIVAREYGIPAVMGTGVATKRIQSGQLITVDGSKGEVILTSQSEKPEGPAPPTEWPRPDPKATYARGSLAEHLPNPVSPLFATLGLRIANRETDRIWEEIVGASGLTLFEGGFYHTINGYVYGGFRMGPRELWAILKLSLTQLRGMFTASTERWLAARRALADAIAVWESVPLEARSASDLLDATRQLFAAAAKYYTVIQASTLPSASTSETLFSLFYRALVKRRRDPAATAFLFGFETRPVRSEKSMFDISAWVRDTHLREYVLNSPTADLADDLERDAVPPGTPGDLWREWHRRIRRHVDEFGATAYEYDFVNPTPGETLAPMLEALKASLAGQGSDPHARQRAAAEERERLTTEVMHRLRWPFRGWFERLLNWAQAAGPAREDSIFDMGMAHPLIRRILAELGRRAVQAGAISASEDIYWLEESEVQELTAALDGGKEPRDCTALVETRKVQWRAALRATPPVMVPQRSRWQKLMGGGEAKKKDGQVVLKGLGTSAGRITAPACVLLSPEDFPRMRSGNVLVATTTTPAWTPLFALASAVVTDIGGPLSHSSIVAREYGIPAVMAARNATRHIRSGQIVTVDGSAGTVTVKIA